MRRSNTPNRPVFVRWSSETVGDPMTIGVTVVGPEIPVITIIGAWDFAGPVLQADFPARGDLYFRELNRVSVLSNNVLCNLEWLRCRAIPGADPRQMT
jgi:hypothetical protein